MPAAWACRSASSSTSTAARTRASACRWTGKTCRAARLRFSRPGRALDLAGTGADGIALFDLYSCFPIAVFNILDGLGIPADDPRQKTIAGGLPFFGGAGNNYSMHAIANAVRALRKQRGARALVGANGGFLSKYSVGVYSTEARPWVEIDNRPLQAEVDAWPAIPVETSPTGGMLETYTIDHSGEAPKGVVIGRSDAGGTPLRRHDRSGGSDHRPIDDRQRSARRTGRGCRWRARSIRRHRIGSSLR